LSFIRQNLEKAALKQKSHYDRSHNPSLTFNFGDKVLLKDVTLSSKIKGITSSLGPLYGNSVCTIVDKIGDSVFTVQLPTGRKKGRFHISFLRKYSDRENITTPTTASLSPDDEAPFAQTGKIISQEVTASLSSEDSSIYNNNVNLSSCEDITISKNVVDNLPTECEVLTNNLSLDNMNCLNPSPTLVTDLYPITPIPISIPLPLRLSARNLRSLPRWDYAALNKGKGNTTKSPT